MTDFFDWLTAADSGLGADRLAEQFRLSQQEMRRTTDALAPAFLFGLQRLVADPSAWTDFMRSIATLGPDQVANGLEAASPTPMSAMLGKLFGTGVLADAIARHASLMAGVAPDTIRKMMPDLALMTVQAMMRMASAQSGLARPHALPTDAGGQALAEIMRRSANALEAFSRPGASHPPSVPGLSHPSYLEALFADALKGGFPWMRPPVPAPRDGASNARAGSTRDGAGSAADNALFPFMPLFAAMAGAPAASPREPREPSTTARPQDAPLDPLAGMSRMMEAGRSLQESYALEMLALFDKHGPRAE